MIKLNLEDVKNTIVIKSCRIPTLWYNAHVGELFTVTYETDTAVWVKVPDNNNAWVYKTDIE